MPLRWRESQDNWLDLIRLGINKSGAELKLNNKLLHTGPGFETSGTQLLFIIDAGLPETIE